MTFRELLGKQLLFFDGAMGTMLQAAGLKPGTPPDVWCITKPDTVRDIHRAFLRANCNILTTNTFGCTECKLMGSGYSPADVAEAAVLRAREAIAAEPGNHPRFVALDVGPTGRLLKPLGDMAFEDAVRFFSESIRVGAQAGADLVLIETMSDLHELKAAVLAAKESCDLPVCATVTLDKHGRLLTGGDVSAVVALLEGLRVDALGLNCGLGPKEMLPFLEQMRGICSLPLIMTPNAGLPREENGTTVYDLSADEFSSTLSRAVSIGAQMLGGCCGTTPAHMQALIRACESMTMLPVEKKRRTVVSGYGSEVKFGHGAVLIGERINPTGKPKLKQALRDEDYGYVLREGMAQVEHGARVLDVNAGLPGIDEPAVLETLVTQLQSVTDVPLQIDTADPKALARALRVYNGKAMVNSVSGKEDSMRAVFPLVQRYGGVVVALTLDENGIPETADGRVEIARKIIARAAEYGIDQKDIIVDALTMTISAGDQNALVTLETLRRVRQELGVHTILGVSNVSFGLPAREKINAAFFALALGAGLDAAILNPFAQDMLDVFISAQALLGYDSQCGAYIARYTGEQNAPPQGSNLAAMTLEQAVRQGLKQQARVLAAELIKTRDPLVIIEESLVPALNAVGGAFENGTLFLPQLLMSAEAARAAFTELRAAMGAAGNADKGCVVVATVLGDVHDIGKNIVRALLENYQFRVIDLGRDVPPERVLEAARAHNATLVGLSALMTTTVVSMKDTVALIKRELPACKIMVGGAVLTEAYAMEMGADRYAKDAMASVHYAQEVYEDVAR